MAGYDLFTDKLYGHVVKRKTRTGVPRVLPLPMLAAPARGDDRDRAGQLQPAPVDQEGPPGR